MKQVKVEGVGKIPHKNEYCIYLENGEKIRVGIDEYRKTKRKLGGKSEHYLEVAE